MAYAELDDVLARAGTVRGAWSQGSEPSLPEIEGFLSDGSLELDAMILASGSALPAAGTAAAGALRDANATYALLRAYRATPRAVTQQMIDELQQTWDAIAAAMRDGTHPAVALLTADRTPQAGSLWTDETGYRVVPDGMTWDPRVDPVAWRGMTL